MNQEDELLIAEKYIRVLYIMVYDNVLLRRRPVGGDGCEM